YWKALGDTPEFTVLFVPSDGVLAAALETDPDLLEDAFSRDVVIASPATLVALLRTVAHTWRTDALNRDARAVLEAGRELHHRLGTFTGHLGKVGRSLDSSVAAFNEAVGSLQTRVMVTARRFEELELSGTALDEVEQLTRRARTLEEAEIADLAAPAVEGSEEAGRADRAG
ncbi:MAG: DNA recombination protein RmuC, partial [Brachybacterium sp.]|nr:DNA recombination protein RmuC [Brachybacterium sp.]